MAEPCDTSVDHNTKPRVSYSTKGFYRTPSADLEGQTSSSNLVLNNKHHKKSMLQKEFPSSLLSRSKKSCKKGQYDLQTQKADCDDEIDGTIGATEYDMRAKLRSSQKQRKTTSSTEQLTRKKTTIEQPATTKRKTQAPSSSVSSPAKMAKTTSATTSETKATEKEVMKAYDASKAAKKARDAAKAAKQGKKALDKVLKDTKPSGSNKGKTTFEHKAQNVKDPFKDANKRFDSAKPKDVKPLPGDKVKGRTGKVGDRTITVRDKSTSGEKSPTVEVFKTDQKRRITHKVRHEKPVETPKPSGGKKSGGGWWGGGSKKKSSGSSSKSSSSGSSSKSSGGGGGGWWRRRKRSTYQE